MNPEDDDTTKVTRTRPPSEVVKRASSQLIPRISEAAETTPGPEQEAALAEVFGEAFDIISGSSKELTLENRRLKGELNNVRQEKELLRSEVARLKRENVDLRETLRKLRGGR